MIMRLKLFCFGICVAIIGLIRPKEITDMIDTYAEAKELREFKTSAMKALDIQEIE